MGIADCFEKYAISISREPDSLLEFQLKNISVFSTNSLQDILYTDTFVRYITTYAMLITTYHKKKCICLNIIVTLNGICYFLLFKILTLGYIRLDFLCT